MDGDKLKSDPISVMNKIQMQLNVEEFHDYTKFIRFDQSKGFFCGFQDGNTCLGESKVSPKRTSLYTTKLKGRKYERMDVESRRFMDRYYASEKQNLRRLLKTYSYELPSWL